MHEYRTLQGAMDQLKKEDPDTCLSIWYLRMLVENGIIPCKKNGNRSLVNMQSIRAFLETDFFDESTDALKKNKEHNDFSRHYYVFKTPEQYSKNIPVLKKIPEGMFHPPASAIDCYVPVSIPNLDYGFRMKGDSMIGARIFSGDILLIEKSPLYSNGDIVLAQVDHDDAIVRRYYRYESVVILKPENPQMKEDQYIAKQVKLVGKVKEVRFAL